MAEDRNKGGKNTLLGGVFDTRHEFFRPLWIRLLVFAVAAGWTLFEFSQGNLVWGSIFLVFVAIAVHGFFIDPGRAAMRDKPKD